jgi:2,3-bisphosphoglycerate-dependent phosphoglycerate mutase
MVYVIRHAEPEWPANETSPLSAAGRNHAVRLAELLRDAPIDAIYSSPSPRAQQTVEPLAARRQLPVQEVHDLRERSLGTEAFEVLTIAVRATWDDFDFAHPAGESNAAAQRRIVAAHERLLTAHPEGRIVMATHGNVLALLLRHHEPSIGFAFWQALSRPDVYCLRSTPRGRATFARLWKP